MMLLAVVLAAVMAISSAINQAPARWFSHPDEYLHRSAGRYFVDHWLPPKVGAPESLDSYSREYGYSYLNDLDVVYFLAGKFAILLSPFLKNLDLAFRLFNVLLFASVAVFAARRPWDTSVAFVPLLLTAQAWYVFGYFNGDAFPLFLSILIAYQLTAPESAFARFMEARRVRDQVGGLLLFALIVALLLLSKRNYYAFLAMLPALLLLRYAGVEAALAAAVAACTGIIWQLQIFAVDDVTAMLLLGGCMSLGILAALRRRPTRHARLVNLGRLALVGVAAAAFAAPRILIDLAQNGPREEKDAAAVKLAEQLAKDEYKPSRIAAGDTEAFHGSNLRGKGTALRALFAPPWNWHSGTFRSATGYYGWLEFASPRWYYRALGGLYLLLVGYLAFAVIRSRDRCLIVTGALVGLFAGLVVFVSVWHSWTGDFQAQGRYLFPVLPMLGILLGVARAHLNSRVLLPLLSACFLLSCYSFIAVGLAEIPKRF
jgi:hypothetical protein